MSASQIDFFRMLDEKIENVSISEREAVFDKIQRVTHLLSNNLQLTEFRQFRQQVGRYSSYLLPRQDGGTSQI